MDLGDGVPDHGEIHEIGLCLLAEALTFGTLDRREASLPHGLGSGAEALHHGLWIELVRHPDKGIEVRWR